MRRFLMTVAIATTALGMAPIAQAESRPDGPPPVCHKDDRKCAKPEKGEHRREGRGPRDGEGRPGDDRRGPPDACRQGDRHCVKPLQGGQREGHMQEGRRGPPPGMRPGEGPRQDRFADKGDKGRAFRPGKGDHLRDAPRGTEYRVIDDKLVLVNKKTHRIVDIIGAAPRR